MFVTFFHELKSAGVPVTLREYLTLMEAMNADLAGRRVEDFYYLSRAALIKDERNLDKFDRVFGHVFKGLELLSDALVVEIPAEWLKKLAEKYLTEEEKKLVEAMGGLDKLLETLRQRLKEQKGRHQGGSKWIGTAGTSPFGAYGYNPEGVRIGQDESRHQRAVKVWDKREFKDLDGDVELGTRNIKVALRRLRKFARTGAPEELDLDGTIKGTAHKGYLDILMRPERHNAVKVLLFFDIGGSMDWHIKATEELFSAARTEFKHMEHFYFHNCLYEKVWKENRRRWNDTTPTWDVLHTYPHDYKVVFVGDAVDVALRDRGARRLGRAFQRGGRPRLDGARDAHLSGLRLAQPGAGRGVGLYAVDPHDAAIDRRADVSADAGGLGQGDAGIGAMSSNVTRATIDDYNEIVRDIVDFWDSERTERMHHVMYVRDLVDTSYVIKEDGKVIAYLFGFIVETRRLAYASLLGVRSAFRKRGLGTRLYALFIEDARARGCTILKVVTDPSNARSIAFHTRKIGMEVRVIKDYAGPSEDRAVFERAI